MAIGGVPTMMDMDWATINANQKAKNIENFKSEFMMQIKNEVSRSKPKLTWDGSKLVYESPTQDGQATRPMTESELWNRYAQAASNAGIKTDLTYYEQQIAPIYRAFSSSDLSRQVQDLISRGLPAKHFKKLYRADNNFARAYDYTITNTTDPEQQKILSEYRPKVGEKDGMGIAQGIGLTGVVGGGAYGLRQWGNQQPEGWKRNVGKFGPHALIAASPFLAGKLGADEDTIDKMHTAMTVGYPAYYGMQTGSQVMKNRLLTSSLKGNRADLIARAKRLGIDDIVDKGKGRTNVPKIQEKIFEKVKSQSARASASQLGARHLKAPIRGGAPIAPKGLRIKGGSPYMMAASILLPMLLGQTDEWFSGEDSSSLPALPKDERTPYDWSTYDIGAR